ncbi:hypothetical protein BU23DRAFT_78977 [Bimuria novae-zelandiae CBS 107.79]|uniref:C2H2-type domain-containing protein n=1 Tax=Bimuria novae-zelandiae CBS 107.79 TaxID=1447943 RepID=A0A6A5VH13_9PLEO|nr:hypothetical protein BU23DRAFT_78977 [Bimuria novae-zelandiae CBS 107.79]
MATYQYPDLPLVSFPSDDLQHMGWGHEQLAFRQVLAPSEGSYGYIERGKSVIRTQTMERFLLDPSPLTPGLLHANLQHGMSHQRQSLKLYQQWPAPEHPRYDSPDRTSISGNSSYATQTEVRSPCAYHSSSYGSPEDYAHSSSPYPVVDQFKQESLLPELSGGNVNLRDLELYNHEPESGPIIEEGDAASVKMEIDGMYEPDPDYKRIDSGPEGYNASSDSGVSHSRDAESVQPMEASEGESSDADYTPNRSTTRRRSSASTSSSGRQGSRRRSIHRRKSTSAATTSTSKVTKRVGRGVNKVASDAFAVDSQRHFPCPLTTYGCLSTFSSKNEWKRHVSTQHIKLGFWRCDLCTTTVDPHDHETVYHNDFNRKDLFTQHLRRMHTAPTNQSHCSQKEYPVTEDNIAEHQKRCFQILREMPTRSNCLYCDETFTGPSSWENRMEHIGRHLEKDRKVGNIIGDVATWNDDKELERWLFAEGIIAHDKAGNWKIGDGRPRRQGVGEEDSSDDES